MIKVIIIDDEPLARSIVAEFLKVYPDVSILAECGDGFQGLKAIQEHQPELIFLDVQMPKINGFEMLELIEQKPDVIFTTAFDEYAIKAFETNAIDYLLKPFSKERFEKAMHKWEQWRNAKTSIQPQHANDFSGLEQPVQRERVVVKHGSLIKIIPVQEIEYLESADDFVKIHTKDGAFLKNKTMAYFEQTLSQQEFVRTHRSYMIQIAQITRIDPYEKDSFVAVLKNGKKIPVSRSGYPRLRAALGL
ncbi:MAG: LytTR family transcriptional regulator DNA-binding domain-containing protein [Chitinophagaceae bacterium]|nr:LytTR family transcriptional regulator DNA-binding domain-containing protein [Chitinophagaceae bacterium]